MKEKSFFGPVIGFISRALKFIIKEVLSFGIRLILWGILLLTIIGIAVAIFKEENKKTGDYEYVTFNFNSSIKENSQVDLLGALTDKPNFYNLIKTIKTVTTDPHVKGIVINFDKVALNRAQISELLPLLKELQKAGKKIYAYGNYLSNSSYHLVSVADEIVMDPSASTMSLLSGYHSDVFYMKDFLDVLGVEFDVIHIGDYKTAGEPLVKNKMSDEERQSLTRIYDDLFNTYSSDVTKAKKLAPGTFKKDLLNGELIFASSSTLKEKGFIDYLENYDNFIKSRGLEKTISWEDYHKKLVINGLQNKANSDGNKIGIIYIDGPIMYYGKNRSVASMENILESLDKASRDYRIAGIILRINSPGGSALASELIYQKVAQIEKPVYASMGSVAASGGYYIASASDKIFANSNTITGSIGVVSMIPNFDSVADKLKVKRETIKNGDNTGIISPYIELSEKEKEIIYNSSLAIYDEFVERVATGRDMSYDEINKIAQGQVWSGNEALQNKLIDEIGGLERAIDSLYDDLGIEAKNNAIEIKTSPLNGSIIDELGMSLNVYKKLTSFFSGQVEEVVSEEEFFNRPLTILPYEID